MNFGRGEVHLEMALDAGLHPPLAECYGSPRQLTMTSTSLRKKLLRAGL